MKSFSEIFKTPPASKTTLIRATALGLAVLAFYSLEWTPLRIGLKDAVVGMLTKIGHQAASLTAPGQIGLVVDGRSFGISAKCTYLDLILILAPLCWSTRRSAATNLARMLVLAAMVFTVNFVRVVLALHFVAGGHSWYWAHDLPDSIIYWSSFGVAVLVALGVDWYDGRRGGMSLRLAGSDQPAMHALTIDQNI